MVINTEVDLAAVVVNWLQCDHWEVFQEVKNGGRTADIVARRGKVVWVVECKLELNLDVIDQACYWVHRATMVSVATVGGTKSDLKREFLKWKGIGWLQFSDRNYDGYIHVVEGPKFRRKHGGEWKLYEKQKTFCKAGSKSGAWTPFKETCHNIRDAVLSKPGITLKELVATIKHHYSKNASAVACIKSYLESKIIPGVRMVQEDGKLLVYPAEAPARINKELLPLQ